MRPYTTWTLVQDETAHFPPDLKAVIEGWPSLSEADRDAVLAIIGSAINAHGANP